MLPAVPARLALATLVASAALAVAPAGVSADSAPRLPDAAHFVYRARTGGPFVGVVHAVRRTGGVTVLYLSIGTAAPNPLPGRSGADAFLGYGPSSDDRETTVNSSLRLTRLIDTVGGHVYRPLSSPHHPECICTPMSRGVPAFDARTQLVTFAAAFPAVPASVRSVDVDVTGLGFIVTDVAVTDGPPLTPVVGDGDAVLLGHGWPRLDLATAAAVRDVRPFVADLVSRRDDLDDTLRSTTVPGHASIEVSADVLFAVDQATLSPAATVTVAGVAAPLRSARGTVQVTGYTDDTGPAAHNQDLSRRRARAVLAALQRAAPGIRLTASGRGETDPVATNATPEGRRLNRRVTVSFATAGTP